MKTIFEKLEKAKQLRGKLVQYDYKNSKHRFDMLTKIVHDLYDKANEIKRKEREEYQKSYVHKWLMAAKGLNGKQILIHNK